MDILFSHRGRAITAADIAFIRQLIAEHPQASRRALSQKLCAAWNWRQPNGALRDMVCRGLMLALHRAGHIELPKVRHSPPNPLSHRGEARCKPAPMAVDATPLRVSLADLGPIELRQVRRSGEEPLFNSLLEHYHYLGYAQPVGEHLKHLAFAQGRPQSRLSPGPRHRAIWAPATASSAGRRRPVAKTSVFWLTTPVSSFCPSSRFHTWPRIS
jgi:hypothetical protein